MRILLVLMVVVMLGGCSSTPVILKHPTTGETAQCGPYSSVGLRDHANVQREIKCVSDYQAQGYIRIKN